MTSLPPLPDVVLQAIETSSRAGATRDPADVTLGASRSVDLRTDLHGLPMRARAAYVSAAQRLARDQASCALPWQLLAGIGYVESDHGRYAGSQLYADGMVRPPVRGPVLDGRGDYAAIPDTEAGRLDGERTWDRAVGPMQFLPGTWRLHGADGDGDGRRSPDDLDDAALAAGGYLCRSAPALDVPSGLVTAIFAYNHSYDYVRVVLAVTARYLGVDPVTLGTAMLPQEGPSPAPTPSPSSAASSPTSVARPPTPRPSAAMPPSIGEPSATPTPAETAPAETAEPEPTPAETVEPDPTPAETTEPDPTPSP